MTYTRTETDAAMGRINRDVKARALKRGVASMKEMLADDDVLLTEAVHYIEFGRRPAVYGKPLKTAWMGGAIRPLHPVRTLIEYIAHVKVPVNWCWTGDDLYKRMEKLDVAGELPATILTQYCALVREYGDNAFNFGKGAPTFCDIWNWRTSLAMDVIGAYRRITERETE